MEKGIVCLAFDDARADNMHVFQSILFPEGIPATLNVTTGYVDQSCPESFFPSARKALSKEDIISLSASPLIEIAAHGDMHLNTDKDIDRSREKLIDWLGLDPRQEIGFASPASRFSLSQRGAVLQWLHDHRLSYVALAQRTLRWAKLRVLCRKAARVIHLPLLFEFAYHDTLMDSCEEGVVYRVPVLKDTTNRQISRLVDRCAAERKTVVLMFHSVDSIAEDNWVWDERRFRMLCKFLIGKKNEGTVELCTVQHAVCLMQQGKRGMPVL